MVTAGSSTQAPEEIRSSVAGEARGARIAAMAAWLDRKACVWGGCMPACAACVAGRTAAFQAAAAARRCKVRVCHRPTCVTAITAYHEALFAIAWANGVCIAFCVARLAAALSHPASSQPHTRFHEADSDDEHAGSSGAGKHTPRAVSHSASGVDLAASAKAAVPDVPTRTYILQRDAWLVFRCVPQLLRRSFLVQRQLHLLLVRRTAVQIACHAGAFWAAAQGSWAVQCP